MTMTTVTVRLDRAAKDAVAGICEELGLDVSTAVCMFFKKTVNRRKLPLLRREVAGQACHADVS